MVDATGPSPALPPGPSGMCGDEEHGAPSAPSTGTASAGPPPEFGLAPVLGPGVAGDGRHSQLSAQAITAQTAIARMSIS